jgi:hypothetical protein
MNFQKTLIKMGILAMRHDYSRDDAFFSTMMTEADEYEGRVIAPTLKTVMMIYRDGFIPLRRCLQGLADNVSFLYIDLPENLEAFRASCDWCSICNGMIHTAVENLKRQPWLASTIDCGILRVSEFLDQALARRRHTVSQDEIMLWCQRTFHHLTPSLLTVSKIYLQLEQVELRWCPFKRSKAFYYRNRDPRYITPTLENIQKIGEVLARDETVSCERCPREVNAALPPRNETGTVPVSIFQPLLDHMVSELQ